MDFSKFLFNILYGSKIAKGLVWAVEVILNKPKCDLNLSSSGTSQCLTALSLVLVFLSKGKQILLAQLGCLASILPLVDPVPPSPGSYQLQSSGSP